MRVFKSIGLAAVIALTGTGISVRAQSARPLPRAVPGELIIKYKRHANAEARGQARRVVAAAAIAALNRRAAVEGDGEIELVRVPAGTPLETLVQRLRGHGAVEYAEPNWIYTHQTNDPLFPQQWALENSGQSISGIRGAADADVDAPDAWAAGPAATRQVYVGLIDQGVDFNHPDLGAGPGGVIWSNPYDPVDGFDNDGNGYVDDVHGWDFDGHNNTVYDGRAADPGIDWHGTHVAGTIAARRGNGIGVAGVADVTVIPAKFLGIDGGTTANAIRALDYFTDLKTRHHLNIVAVNNSWGGGGFSQALLDAIVRAARADILFIAAAGNGGQDGVGDDNDIFAAYPSSYDTTAAAGYDSVIAVTATGQSDELADFANYGASTVDLGAPGVLIASTSPQNSYALSSGTSMAAPHVTGAAAFANATSGLTGPQLRAAILGAVDQTTRLVGRTVTGGRLNLARLVRSPATPPVGSTEVVLLATDVQRVAGNWTLRSDASAAGGSRLQSTNAGAAKIAPALPAPNHFFEMTFSAVAGRPYHLWIRGRAENNSWSNDSVHVQFDGSVDENGAATYRIGSASSAEVNLEDCSGCGLSGWGWQDNGYGSGVLGRAIYFSTTGPQRLRVQTREDGLGIDQIVLSGSRYLSSSPGTLKDDRTFLGGTAQPAPAPSPVANDEVTLYASDSPLVVGAWTRTTDASAAGGFRLQNANVGAPKITTAQADPRDYFELTFRADAGKPYRLWIRGKAGSNNWTNDSVHVQFNDAVTPTGAGIYRIGTSSAVEVNLEDCSGCGLSGWGWQDNGYGANVLGTELRFANSGTHTIRVQVREDGIGIDQIVLSAAEYLRQSPGTLKNDTTLLPRVGQ